MTHRPSRRRRTLALVSLLAATVALASLAATASASGSSRRGAAAAPPSAAKWKQLVAQAKKEGTVNIYSVEIPTLLADTAAKFKAKYGISVTVNRQIDNVLEGVRPRRAEERVDHEQHRAALLRQGV